MAEAGSNYILLAIGDGLVAQVPALMLSIAAAVIVTRVSSPLDLTGQMSSQFGSAAAWTPVAAILALLGVLPGMPQMIILPAAGLAAYAPWRLKKALPPAPSAPETADPAPPRTEETRVGNE